MSKKIERNSDGNAAKECPTMNEDAIAAQAQLRLLALLVRLVVKSFRGSADGEDRADGTGKNARL